MSFRPLIFSRWALALGFLTLLSCGLKFGEKPPKEKPLGAGSDKFNCITQLGEVAKRYINDELSLEEVQSASSCIVNRLSDFETFFMDEKNKYFKPEDLREFIHRKFYGDNDKKYITDELLHQAMRVKVAMVGGSDQKFSRVEFRALIDLIQFFSKQAERLHPFVKYYNPDLSARVKKPLRTDEAILALKEVAQNIGARFGQAREDYSLYDLESLLVEGRNLVKWEESFETSKPVSEWMRFFRAYKSASLGPLDLDHLSSHQWVELFSRSAGWFSLYLRFHHEVDLLQALRGQGLDELVKAFNEGVVTLKKSVMAQPSTMPRVITFKQLDELIQSAGALGFLSDRVREKSVIQAARPFVERLFGDENFAPKDRKANGISLSTISGIQKDFDNWSGIQYYINEKFQTEMHREKVQVAETDDPFDLSIAFRKDAQKDASIEELSALSTRLIPLYKWGDARTFMVYPSQRKALGLINGHYNSTMLNLYRAMAKIVLRGYSTSKDRRAISGEELQEFTDHFKFIFEDFYIIRPQNQTAGKSVFNMANLFTFQANGLNQAIKNPKSESEKVHHLLEFEEAIEFIGFMVSAASSNAKVYDFLRANCPTGPLDIFHRETLDIKCSEAHLRELFIQNFDHLPGMVKFLRGLSEEDWQKFYSQLHMAAFDPDDDLNYVTDAQLATYTNMLHFVEAIMIRYDTNEDGIVNENEGEGAFKTFKGVVEMVLGKNGKPPKAFQTEIAFKYIMQYEEVPVTYDWFLKVDVITALRGLWGYLKGWDIKMTRYGASKIITIALMVIRGETPPGVSNGVMSYIKRCVHGEEWPILEVPSPMVQPVPPVSIRLSCDEE